MAKAWSISSWVMPWSTMEKKPTFSAASASSDVISSILFSKSRSEILECQSNAASRRSWACYLPVSCYLPQGADKGSTTGVLLTLGICLSTYLVAIVKSDRALLG